MISHIMHTHKEPAKELSKELEKQNDARKVENYKRDTECKGNGSIIFFLLTVTKAFWRIALPQNGHYKSLLQFDTSFLQCSQFTFTPLTTA